MQEPENKNDIVIVEEIAYGSKPVEKTYHCFNLKNWTMVSSKTPQYSSEECSWRPMDEYDIIYILEHVLPETMTKEEMEIKKQNLLKDVKQFREKKQKGAK